MQGDFTGGSEVKASACNVGDLGSIPGSGRCPGEGNGNPLQYSCLESPMDGGSWWAAVQGVSKSWTRLSNFKKKKKKILQEECLHAMLLLQDQERQPFFLVHENKIKSQTK